MLQFIASCGILLIVYLHGVPKYIVCLTNTITIGINLDHLYSKHQWKVLVLEILAMIYIQYIHHVQFQYHGVKTRALHSPPPWGQNQGVTLPSPLISIVLSALQN